MENNTQQAEGAEKVEAKPFEPSSTEKHVGMAVVAYILFFVPLLTDAKDDPFVKYHVKQGFVLLCAGVLTWLVLSVVLGGMFSFLFFGPLMVLLPVLQLAFVVLAVLGIINAAQGKKAPLPLIGHLSEKVTFFD